jgi:DNA-binding PadR family transcriptional regulator
MSVNERYAKDVLMHRHYLYRGQGPFEDACGRGYYTGHGRYGRRFGVFAGGFTGGMGMGGRAFRAGRRLASGDLQLVLLALLAERPSHGYELIKALEERSGGFYSPSPGMIYPALTWLEEVGYASVAAEGAKKLYSLTEAGRQYLRENQESADAMLGQLEHIGRKMGRVREIFGGVDEDHEPGDSPEMRAARHELKQALREKRHVTAEERGRIAAILKDAAAQIRGKS